MAGSPVTRHDVVLDLGAGLGALTRPLAATGARVIAVELHPRRAAALRQQYAGSRVTIPGLGTAGSPPWVTIPASRVAWGVTIASNSRHRDAAVLFLSSLLGPTGRDALAANGPAPLVPARVSRSAVRRLPNALRERIGSI